MTFMPKTLAITVSGSATVAIRVRTPQHLVLAMGDGGLVGRLERLDTSL